MRILRRISNRYFKKWTLLPLITFVCLTVLGAMMFRDKSYDVFFEGPTGDSMNFASASKRNPHSWIVQGADFDKVWRARIGDVNYEIGFSYRFVKNSVGIKKILVESLVLSFVEDGLRVNTAPLAYFFGNRHPYEGTDKTPNAEMPPLQSSLSFGLPSNVKTLKTKDGFKLKMSFNQPFAHIYSLRKASLGEWLPRGFKSDIIPHSGLTADVSILFSRRDPYKVSIDTTRRLSKNIDNHNGFNLLTQIVYSSAPVKVAYSATGQIVEPAIGSKQIASLQLLEDGWQMIKTREFDKGRKILGRGKKFDNGWTIMAGNRKIAVKAPGFADFAIREPYIDTEKVSHIPNNLYTFRYNGWYDYIGCGYTFAVIESDPLVVKASPAETHLGKGWMSARIASGEYRDKSEIDFNAD